MKIGYGKIGRSWQLDESQASTVGGDIDVVRVLKRLATEHPEHEFILIGRNTGQNPKELGYPPNVVNPWTEWRRGWPLIPDGEASDVIVNHFRELSRGVHESIDQMLIWAGQHGSANSFLPQVGLDWSRDENKATPYVCNVNYVSWFLDFISRWREHDIRNREEVWLVPDPRNYLKGRELRWPLRRPVIAQYNISKNKKFERYDIDDRDHPPHLWGATRHATVWAAPVRYEYHALELTAIPDPETLPFSSEPGDVPFGMIINENARGVKDQRLDVMLHWVKPHFPDAVVHGTWTKKSQEKLEREISPLPYDQLYDTLRTFRTTFTTPASGSGWATSKPWECFAAGSICFFHPRYDDQGHILPKNPCSTNDPVVRRLSAFLRVNTPGQLRERVEQVNENDDLWGELADLQRRYLHRRWSETHGGLLEAKRRLGLHGN